MTGSTTTGSIDGKLRLDISDFLAKVETVKSESRALGQEHPSINVDANTGKAQASMAAVDAAATAMGQSAAAAGERVKRSANDVAASEAKQAAAMEAARLAAKAEELAAMRLDEVQNKRGRTDLQVAAAELALERATNRAATAASKAVAAGSALAQARESTSKAALEEAAAEEVVAKATNNAADSAGRANARTQLIIAAVVALTALAAPLTGALLGVAGGLAGLGAVGILGIVGVVQQIKQGTKAGEEWSTGLKSLKGDLSQLAGTAATGMLSTFQRSVAVINQSMPELNREVAGFTRVLGVATMSALQGVITAFHVLNPLFMQGAGVVQDMASGFESWTSNGGLQKFASYAQATLPQVIGTIGHLADAILHIAEATAPIGSVVLAILDGLANAITALPIPVLTTLAGVAITVYAGFMLWKGVTGVFNAVKATAETLGLSLRGLSLAGGVVGIALTALATVFALVAQANAEANARAQAYADTLDKVTGQTTEASRKMTVDALNVKQGFGLWQQSAFDAAKSIGISAKTMTDAYMGVPSAVKQVTEAMEKGVASGKLTELSASILQDTMKQGADTTRDAADAFRNQADAMGASSDANKTGALTAQGAADAYQAEASAADQAMSKLNGLIDATNRLNGVGQSAEETNARWQKSLEGITTDAQAQSDAFEKANGTLDGFSLSLDANTASGSSNRAMLTGAAADAQAATKAQFDLDVQTMSSKDATDKYAGTLAAQRQAFIDSAVGAGYNAGEVQNLADKIFAMPSKKDIDILAHTGDAQNVIDSFINRNDGRTVTIYTSVQGQYAQVAGQLGKSTAYAYGGTIPGAAYGVTGGTVRGNGSAWSDTAGMYRLANGEEVTSNTSGQADRWRSLLKAINGGAAPAQVAGQAMRMAGVKQAAPAMVNFAMPSVRADDSGAQIRELASQVANLTARLAALMERPTDLSPSSVDRLTRAIATTNRVTARQGG